MNELKTLESPADAFKVATELQRFVKEKKLTVNIKGKDYPLVEAWMFAGSQLGLYPLLIETKDLSSEKEIKYMATVEVRRITSGQVVSRGVAICSNKESSKRNFDEYAILSMAQTRAAGKAFRMLLSWVMKAAGFEATPAEEMDFKDVVTESDRKVLRELVFTGDMTDEEKEAALSKIETCNDLALYNRLLNRLEARQKQPI